MKLTYDECRLLRNTLGLDRSDIIYRNHFAASPEHVDIAVLEGLARNGLMVRETAYGSDGLTFRVTRRGKEALWKREYLTRFESDDICHPTYPRSAWDECIRHRWVEVEVESQYANEHSTEVGCSRCGAPGERDRKSGSVYWPVT